jgi:branched-chain amino acid aminotransferase
MTACGVGSKVWMDGHICDVGQAHIDMSDRGFTLGDGLFETMLWTGKHIRYFDDHMARLARAASELAIALPWSAHELRDGLNTLAQDAGGQTAAIRLTLTRGTGPRGLAFPPQTVPHMLATLAPYAPSSTPLRLKTVTIARNCGAPSARFKTLSYVDNVMALNQARSLGADDAIMLGTNANVACSSGANIVIVLNGRALTPNVEDGALPGIVRGRLIAAGLVDAACITTHMLAACQAAVLTNALVGIRPVAAINARFLDSSLAVATELNNALALS